MRTQSHKTAVIVNGSSGNISSAQTRTQHGSGMNTALAALASGHGLTPITGAPFAARAGVTTALTI